MPPQTGSRYGFCLGVLDERGRRFLTEREPYRYRPLPDNRVHRVVDGDTLFVWPTVLSIETVLTDLEFQYKQFAGDATLLVYTAVVTFEEILDARVTSEDKRQER